MEINGERKKVCKIINISIIVVCFLIIILGISFVVNTKKNDLQSSIKTFVDSSTLKDITNDKIKKFIDDNNYKGEIAAICVNEQSQSYPSLPKSETVNKIRTEIFSKKMTKSEIENNNDLKSYIEGYNKEWLTDYSGRDYLIIYKESKSPMFSVGIGMIIIGLIGFVAWLVYFRRDKNKIRIKVKEVSEEGNNSQNKTLGGIGNFEVIVGEKFGKEFKEALKEELMPLRARIEESSNLLKTTIEENSNTINKNIKNAQATLQTSIKKNMKNFEDVTFEIKGINSKLDNMSYEEQRRSLEDIISKIGDFKNEIGISTSELQTTIDEMKNNSIDNNEVQYGDLKKDFNDISYIVKQIWSLQTEANEISKKSLGTDEVIKAIKQESNSIKISLEEELNSIKKIIINENKKKLKSITSEIKGINYKLDTMNYEDQTSYLRNIQLGIESFKNEIKTSTREMNNVVDSIKLNGVNEDNDVENIKNQYNTLTNDIDNISYMIKDLLYLQKEATEILRKTPETVEIISDNAEIKDKILEYIGKAEKYIYITIFQLTQEMLIESLIKKDESVEIKIIIDEGKYDELMEGEITKDSDKYFGKIGRSKKLKMQFHTLINKSNVEIRVKSGTGYNDWGYMHRKEIVLDDKYALSGSANFTNGGFIYNIERYYVFNLEEYALRHKNDFNELWKKSSSYSK